MDVMAPNPPACHLPGSFLEYGIAFIAMVGHKLDRW
jgi:hypothetical protein